MLFALLGTAHAAPDAEKIRTISEINAFPKAILKRTISPTLYGHIANSPVEAWVAVRGSLSGTSIYGARVVHSEGGGKYDQYALELAEKNKIAGRNMIAHINHSAPVLLHVLIFKIADGTMALSFAHFDGPEGEHLEYYGSTRLAVEQPDGQWKDLKLPQGSYAKGWVVREGLANNFELAMKLERIETR